MNFYESVFIMNNATHNLAGLILIIFFLCKFKVLQTIFNQSHLIKVAFKDWFIKNRTKHSSNTLLSLVWIFMNQSLCITNCNMKSIFFPCKSKSNLLSKLNRDHTLLNQGENWRISKLKLETTKWSESSRKNTFTQTAFLRIGKWSLLSTVYIIY